jgi:hypothetical protein
MGKCQYTVGHGGFFISLAFYEHLSRYVNTAHGEYRNLDMIPRDVGGYTKLLLITNRVIRAGEDLAVGYGRYFFEGTCFCPACK